jgi:hypothetical protein
VVVVDGVRVERNRMEEAARVEVKVEEREGVYIGDGSKILSYWMPVIMRFFAIYVPS